MTHYKIGLLPYANALPYSLWFEHVSPHLPVEFVKGLPSELPQMLMHGQIDVMLTSSYVALSTAALKMAEGVSISSFGAVASVKLFSQVHPSQIQVLSPDPSSLTSNRLAQIILAEKYQNKPKLQQVQGTLQQKLEQVDAVVLIGDPCLKEETDFQAEYVLDLGEEWSKLTGLPFVWALWLGREKLSPELVGWLQEAKSWSMANIEFLIEHAVQKTGWTPEFAMHYYNKHIDYRCSEKHLQGLERYQEYLLKHRYLQLSFFPQPISAG